MIISGILYPKKHIVRLFCMVVISAHLAHTRREMGRFVYLYKEFSRQMVDI